MEEDREYVDKNECNIKRCISVDVFEKVLVWVSLCAVFCFIALLLVGNLLGLNEPLYSLYDVIVGVAGSFTTIYTFRKVRIWLHKLLHIDVYGKEKLIGSNLLILILIMSLISFMIGVALIVTGMATVFLRISSLACFIISLCHLDIT